MGRTVPKQDYVIVFDASSDTLYDTLLFFHYDLLEARASRTVGEDVPVSRVIAVAAAALREDCSFPRYLRIEDDQMVESEEPELRLPACAHFLHLRAETEIALHRHLSRQFARHRIPMVNPYTPGTASCDSKFRMYQTLRACKVKTPETILVSRFRSPGERQATESRVWESPRGFYIQPDRGTEGQGCRFLLPQERHEALGLLREAGGDWIARPRRGNASYQGRNLVCRINVCFDGKRYVAETGYAMVGGEVVCAAQGATREDINRVLAALDPSGSAARALTGACRAACRALFQGAEPTLACGVDAVLEADRRTCRAYVVDVNPRPVVVGSRVIGGGAISLGQAFWRGVCARVASSVGSRSGRSG